MDFQTIGLTRDIVVQHPLYVRFNSLKPNFFSEQFLYLYNSLITFMYQHHCSLLKCSGYHNSIFTENNGFVTIHSEITIDFAE